MRPEAHSNERRILVALDASPSSMDSLEMAVNLAARMRAQLETLFVEDINLLRLAALPFAAELDRSSGEARSMNEAGITSALQAYVERLRRRLDWFSEHRKIQYSLRTVRGDYLTEAMQADSDILFIYTSKRISMGEATDPSRSTALRTMRRGVPSIFTVYSVGDRSGESLRLAVELADILGTELVIVLPVASDEELESYQTDVAKQLGKRTNVSFKIANTDFARTASEIAKNGCSLLVLPKHGGQSDLNEMNALRSLHCPLVLVG